VSDFGHLLFHPVVQLNDSLCLSAVFVRLFHDSLEEEGDPAVPVLFLGDRKQALVINIPVSLKVGADVECGAGENTFAVENQRDEHPSDAAISVRERMDQFKLGLENRKLDDTIDIDLLFAVQISLPIGKGIHHLPWVGGDEGCSFDWSAARGDPILTVSNLTWIFVSAPDARQKNAMKISDHVSAEGSSLQLFYRGIDRLSVVDNLVNVTDGWSNISFFKLGPFPYIGLVLQDVFQRCLGAFDS